MAALFISIWAIGLAGVGLISAVIRSDSAPVVRAGRVGFAFLLAIELFSASIFYIGTSGGNGSGSLPTTTDSTPWWLVALACGIPIVLLAGFVMRGAYGGHRVTLISAVLAATAMFLAFPLGFVAPGRHLTGLGRFEHEHHALDVLALLAPTLILLASEALRGRVADPDHTDPTFLERLKRVPRAVLVGIAVAVVGCVVLLGLNGSGALYFLGIAVVGLVLFGAWRTHVAAQRVRRDLER